LAVPGIESRWGPDFPHPSAPSIGATNLLHIICPLLFPVLKRPSPGAVHPTHQSPKSKSVGKLILPHWIFVACSRTTFTFTFLLPTSILLIYIQRLPRIVWVALWYADRSPTEILGSNPTRGIDICQLWVSCVVRKMSLRRADHSSRWILPTVLRRCVWSGNIRNRCSIYIYIYIYIYDISYLRVKVVPLHAMTYGRSRKYGFTLSQSRRQSEIARPNSKAPSVPSGWAWEKIWSLWKTEKMFCPAWNRKVDKTDQPP
jgi:hypothetical protein